MKRYCYNIHLLSVGVSNGDPNTNCKRYNIHPSVGVSSGGINMKRNCFNIHLLSVGVSSGDTNTVC